MEQVILLYIILRNLPVDRIKISKSLIDKIHNEEFEYAIVKSVIEMSKIKGLKVIAEGVEEKEQFECLKDMGCNEIQGYYFSRPVNIEDIKKEN